MENELRKRTVQDKEPVSTKASKAQYEDLAGKRFGMLTVLEKVTLEEQQKGDTYAQWLCQCDCGGKITVSSKRLKRGTVTNCGCIPKKNAKNGGIAEDLTGRIYGKLAVLYRDKNRNGRTCWVCRCACGNLHSAAASDLKVGSVTSCGCAAYKDRPYMDLTGQRFGRLTVVRRLEKRTRAGSVIWKCVCECGNVIEASQYCLTSNKTTSCGCRVEEVKQLIHTRLHQINGTMIECLGRKKARLDNKTNAVGISQRGDHSYRTTICLCGERYDLGTYKTLEEAIKIRKQAEEQLHKPVIEAFRKWSAYAEAHSDWAKENPLRFKVRRLGQTEFRVEFYGLPEDEGVFTEGRQSVNESVRPLPRRMNTGISV